MSEPLTIAQVNPGVNIYWLSHNPTECVVTGGLHNTDTLYLLYQPPGKDHEFVVAVIQEHNAYVYQMLLAHDLPLKQFTGGKISE